MIFTVGFAIATNHKSVLLVEKTHPNWQKGRLNGIGGRVQNGESSWLAQPREFREETKGRLVGSALYQPTGWRHFATLNGVDWECACFVGYTDACDLARMHNDRNDEGERLVHTEMVDVHCANVNLLVSCAWLIPFAVQLEPCHVSSLPLVITESAPGAMSRWQDRRKVQRP